MCVCVHVCVHVCVLVSHQVSMKHPVGVKVMDAIQDLVEKRFDHALWYLDHWLLTRLHGSVILDYVLQ